MGATEIIFIFAVYLLLFGAKGIPSLAKTMGQAVRTFRNATEDIQREILSEDRPKSRDFSNVRDVTQPRDQREEQPVNVGDGPLKDAPEAGRGFGSLADSLCSWQEANSLYKTPPHSRSKPRSPRSSWG